MRRAIICIALALNGCAILPHRTVTRYITTACVTPQQYETLKAQEPPKIHDRMTGDEDHDIKILAGSLIRVRAYSDGLLEVLGGCTKADEQLAGNLLEAK
jgi:hypothetical protein